MTEKKTIKVVKRAERNKRPTSVRAAREKKRKTATNMVDTVTSWVNDLQQRQRTETSKAIESLVRARQPNEA
jgi:hypothetical protein